MHTSATFAFAACLLASSQTVSSQGARLVVVRDAWVREAAVTQLSTGAYCTIENQGAAPVTLVAAEIDGAGIVELHEMKMTGDVMGMVKRSAIEIPAGGSVELKPGGLHLMLFQLKRAFEPGGTATITLRFAGGGSAMVRAEIRKKAAVGT